MKKGLVSITFRQLSVQEIVELVARTNLNGIEWGGDIHVPHGDLDAAREAARLTTEAGLTVASYGSYYHAPESEGNGLSFDAVLETALALKAPSIRVWAGSKSSADADADYRAEVADALRHVAGRAAKHGLGTACEFHGGSLTDTADSAASLMAELQDAGVRQYWQPPAGQSVEDCLTGLRTILPYLGNLHVFHWHRGDNASTRLPLAEGEAAWRRYIDLAETKPGERWALLEFTANDDPDQFLKDAAALDRLIPESS